MTKKYTYNDWFQGLVNIESEKILIKFKHKPVILSYAHFSVDDRNRIRVEKRMVFNQKVQDLLIKRKESFKLELGRSENKLGYINNCLNSIDEILVGKIPNAKMSEGGIFELENQSEIQNFFQKWLTDVVSNKRTNEKFDFVHSVNSKFKPSLYNQVFAQFLYEFKLYVLNVKLELGYEPINYHDHIFTNGFAYNFFKDLILKFEEINGNLKKADLDFVIYNLKKDNAIYNSVTQYTLIEFFDLNMPELKFSINDFKGRDDTPRKLEIYNIILKQYLNKF